MRFRSILVVVVALVSALVASVAEGAALSPYKGAAGESNLGYLFAAYTITWVGFFIYLFVMERRQRELRREVRELRRALEEREKKGGQGPTHVTR